MKKMILFVLVLFLSNFYAYPICDNGIECYSYCSQGVLYDRVCEDPGNGITYCKSNMVDCWWDMDTNMDCCGSDGNAYCCAPDIETELECADDEVILNETCVKENEACTDEFQYYDEVDYVCRCDIGYAMISDKCYKLKHEIMYLDLPIFNENVQVGDTISKYITFNGRAGSEINSVYILKYVYPTYHADKVTISETMFDVLPGSSNKVKIDLVIDDSFRSNDLVEVKWYGYDDKYIYLGTVYYNLNITDPTSTEYDDVCDENHDIIDEELPLERPELSEDLEVKDIENTGQSMFDELSRLLRIQAFGVEDSAKIESVISLYSKDPDGDLNLITALSIFKLIPVDELSSGMKGYVSGKTTISDISVVTGTDYMNSKYSLLGSLSSNAKDKVYENLGGVLPKLIKRKSEIESAHDQVRSIIKSWEQETVD